MEADKFSQSSSEIVEAEVININSYPFPIAFYYRNIKESDSLSTKLKFVFETYEKAIIYISLLLLSCYYQKGQRHDEIEAAIGKLECPGLENWYHFLQTVIRYGDDQSRLVSQIKQWYRQIESESKIYLYEIKEYKRHERETGLLANLYEIHDAILPVVSIMLEEELQTYFNFCHSSLVKILDKLHFLTNFPLYWIANPASKTAKKLHGPERKFAEVPFELSQQIPANQVILYDSETDRSHLLHPFIVYQECYYCIREELGETCELFLFSGRTTSRLCYSGGIHHVALREHLNEYLEIRERQKPPEESISSIKDIWETAFQITEEYLNDLRGKKILRHYHERRNAEFLLEGFINNPDYPLFLLSGNSGGGKTVLLAEMAKRWSAHGEVVLFLPVWGNFGCDLTNDIAIRLGGTACWQHARAVSEQNKQRWIIILDGAENSSDPQNFFKGVMAFADQYRNSVKIIISVRLLYYRLWQRYLVPANGEPTATFFMPIDGRCPLMESSQPYFLLPQLSMAEVEKAYRTMCLSLSPPLTDFSNFSRNIRGMLRQPSLMTVFLMCLKNREVPKSLGISDIMEGFVLNQINFAKHRREFLEHFLETLLKNQKNKIGLDELVDNGNALLINEVLAPSSFSSFVELLREGILGRELITTCQDKQIIIYFPLALLREYLVYRSLALIGKHRDDILIEHFRKIEAGNDVLYGVVYFAMLRLANKQYFDRLARVVSQADAAGPYLRHIVYNILVFKEETTSGNVGDGGAADLLVNSLLANPCREALLALADFAVYLYNESKFSAAAYLFDKLSQQNLPERAGNYDEPGVLSLAAYSYQKTGDSKRAIKIYKRIYKILKKIENTSREAEFFSFLARAHRELGDREKAEYFFKKCYALKDKIKGKTIEAELYEDFGKIAEQNGDHEKALKYFKRQQTLFQRLGREDRLGEVFENVARIYYRLGNKTDSTVLLEKALDMHEEIGDSRRLAFCQKKLGIVLADMGKFEEAADKFRQCLPVLESLEEQVSLADTYLQLGRICEQLGEEDKCRDYFNKAMEILKKSGDENSTAECYEKFGMMDLKRGNADGAIIHFEKGLNLYQKSNNRVGIGNIYNHLGNAYQRKGMLKEAHKYYQESLKLRDQVNDKAGCAEVYNNLAIIFAHGEELATALEHLKKAKKLYEELDHKKGLATVTSTEALIYKIKSDNSQALECYQRCAQLLTEINENMALGAVYNSIGLIYKERSDFYEALSYFEKSIKIQKTIQDWAGLAASYNNIGLIYDARNEYEKALEYYSKDLEITEKLGDKRGLATSYNNIAILHYNHRNYARALWYLEKSVSVYTELQDQDMVDKLNERIQHVRKKL